VPHRTVNVVLVALGLAMMGLSSCAGEQIKKSADQAAIVNEADKRKQAIAAAWRDLDAVWEHGSDYAFGRHGIWPFDKAGKDAVLKKTEQFDACVATLERLGEIRSIEADALGLEWDFIQEQIELLPAADLRKGYPEDNAHRQVAIKKAGELLSHLTAVVKAKAVSQQVVQVVHRHVVALAASLKYDYGQTSGQLAGQARIAADKLLASCLKLESRTAVESLELESHPGWDYIEKIAMYGDMDYVWDRDVKDSRIVAVDKDLKFSYAEDARRERRLLGWAKGQLGELAERRLICPAQRDALLWMLPALPVVDEKKDRDVDLFSPQAYENSPEADRWVGLFAELADQKSMLSPLHPILMSAMETRINLAASRDLGLCLVHPGRYRFVIGDSGHYSLANRKKMRQALAAVRKTPLADGAKLLETDEWGGILRAYAETSALARRPWLISFLDRRRIGELFEPLDRSISSLVAKGFLTKPEAEFLRDRRRFMLDIARYDEDAFDTSGIQTAACNRLWRRVKLLDKLAMLDRTDWRIADYIFPAVEGDISLLDDLEEDFKWGKGPSEYDILLDESPLEKELKVWTDGEGRIYKADDFDHMGRHESTVEKMIILRDASRAVLGKIRARQTIIPKDLAETNEWRALNETWRDAQAITISGSSSYSLTRFGLVRLVGRLADSIRGVENLRRSELLSDAEAGLLSSDLKLFIQAAEYHDPWEESQSTADTLFFPMYKERWPAFGERVALLAKLVESPTLRPEIVSKIIYSLEGDVALRSMWRHVRKTSPAEKKQIAQAKKSARKLIGKMRKRLRRRDSSLADSAEWRRISEAFSQAADAAGARTTFRKREDIRFKLEQAFTDIYLLYAQGMLTRREVRFVEGEIAEARARLVYSPPADFGNGLYMNAMSHFVDSHPCDEVMGRAYTCELEDMFGRKPPGPEILKVITLSLEADIRILENRPLPYCCDEHEPEGFVEQTAKLKAVLAKVRGVLSEAK
jgi:hypothetical protein